MARARSGKVSPNEPDRLWLVIWEITAIQGRLEQLSHRWARAIGITGPQYKILLAVSELNNGEGVPVNVAAKLLQVDPSFVTTQSKMLEKNGLLRRKSSVDDGRVVEMSLTAKGQNHLADTAAQRRMLDHFLFEQFDNRESDQFIAHLASLKTRIDKALLKMALED